MPHSSPPSPGGPTPAIPPAWGEGATPASPPGREEQGSESVRRLWAATLQELQPQMTRATFDTWLLGSTAVELVDGVLLVRVRSAYAIDWLETRLAEVVFRTATHYFPGLAGLRYTAASPPSAPGAPGAPVASPPPAEEQVQVELVVDPDLARFDVETAGWSKLANYALEFWAELLGPTPFLTWMAIKAHDTRRKKTPWTPPRRFSVSRLARQAAAGQHQAITGVRRTCRAESILRHNQPCEHCQARGGEIAGPHTCHYWRPGAWDILQAEGVAVVALCGSGLRVTYQVRVFNVLPLLTPAQVARLHPLTQEDHDRWIRGQGLDAEAWERLTVAHLALPPFP